MKIKLAQHKNFFLCCKDTNTKDWNYHIAPILKTPYFRMSFFFTYLTPKASSDFFQ